MILLENPETEDGTAPPSGGLNPSLLEATTGQRPLPGV